MKELFITEVGSTMWKMNNMWSDQDLFSVYQMSTYQLLSGLPDDKSEQTGSPGVPGAVDRQSHEIGVVVTQLLKNNWNFVVGVLSPIVVKGWIHLSTLRGLTVDCLSRDIYNSVHGMALHNYKKYIENDHDNTPKRRDTIARTLRMANILLTTGKIEFAPVRGATVPDLLKGMEDLTEARDNSVLPVHSRNEMDMRSTLFSIRLEDLYATLDGVAQESMDIDPRF